MIDNNNNFYNKLILFWSKLKKQGFTLAEALIITVMTGYCLLPILGTMQNAQSRTQEYDHQSKMQKYTRSRLTAEIANAAFDHTSVNTDPEYHYIIYLDKGIDNNDGQEENAKLIELPKTSVTPDQLKTLSKTSVAEWDENAIRLLDIKVTGPSIPKPYLNILHIYKTTVETNNNPALDYDGSRSAIMETPKALLGIVVRTALIESNGDKYNENNGYLQIKTSIPDDEPEYQDDPSVQVLPYSLFSFVNLPVVTDEMIWLADAANYIIYGVDPISRGISKIQLPKNATELGVSEVGGPEEYRPRFLAIHPSLKLLACSTTSHIYLINIDKKSAKYGKYIKCHNFENNLPAPEGGIAFRSDGKYLFAYPEPIPAGGGQGEKYGVLSFEVECNIDPSNNQIIWKPDDPISSEPKLIYKNKAIINKSILKDSLTANDGNLYIAYESKKNGVIRFPMFCDAVGNSSIGWASEPIVFETKAEDENNLTEDIKSIDVSPDGNILAIIANKDLYLYDTRSGEKIISKTISSKVSDRDVFEPNKVTFSALSSSGQTKIYDDMNLIFTVTNKLKDNPNVAKVFYYDSNYNTKDIKFLRNINKSGNKGGNFAINSPDNKFVVMTDQEKSQLYYGTVGNKDSEDVISEDNNNYTLVSNTADSDKNSVDITTNKRDTLAVAAADKIKLYDLNLLKPIEDIELKADVTITSLAMNPQGNMLLTGFGSGLGSGGTGFSSFNLYDLSKIDKGSGYGKKVTFDDRSPNMAFTLEYPSGTGFKQNAFWNVDCNFPSSDPNWDETNSAYLRKNFNLHSEWQRLDMIGMPRGGALALYGKSDGSSMLEWIGRINWNQDPTKIGKYKLFARWTNIYIAPIFTSTSFLPTLPKLQMFETTDSDEGGLFRITDDVKPNTEVKTFEYQAADDSSSTFYNNFGDNSTRYITPILFEKQTTDPSKLLIVNYATNEISTTKGLKHENVPITWKYPFVIDKENTYYLGWWNGSISKGKNKGVVSWNGTASLSGRFLAGIGGGGNTLPTNLIDDSNIIRNYSIRFKVTPVKSKTNSYFPPLYSNKIAISPDCGTLAILSKVTDSSAQEDEQIPRINLYDFNNQIYGPETQLEGMLIDYRQSNASFGGGDTWPNEIESVFNKKVPDQTRFNTYGNESEPNIPTLASATTKYETWESYRTYPANYYVRIGGYVDRGSGDNYIDEIKQYSSKRFFGYYRPEINANYMQSTSSKDIRFFLNGKYLNGRKNNSIYSSGGGGSETFNPFDSPININIKANSISLLQKDEAYSSSGCLGSNIFVASVSSYLDDIEDKTNHPTYPACDANQIGNTFSINSQSIKNIHYINSSDTFILFNKPSFMGSFKAQTTSGSKKTLNINYINMLFSRDKAKPVLYIAGNKYVWALYKNSLIRTYKDNSDEGDNITSNIAISEDGQKLLYSKQIDGVASISVNNISNPDETKFNSTNISSDEIASKQINASSLIVTNFANSYLKETSNITVKDTIPSLIAAKPYVSYKSSNAGGEYIQIATDTSFDISNNASAVASGGIYIVSSDTRNIAVFNPTISSNTITILTNALEKKANSAAVTAYNDNIYMFGNSGDGTDDDLLSGRVQSYDVNEKKAMTSPTVISEYKDSYQVNLTITRRSSDSNYASNFGYNSGDYHNNVGDYIKGENMDSVCHAFVSHFGDYAVAANEHPKIQLNFDYPMTVNQIKINNHTGNSGKIPVISFSLKGLNDSGETELLNEDDIGICENNINSLWEKDITDAQYKTFNFYLNKTENGIISNSNKGGIKLIQLWRTGVKLLTPRLKSFSSESANQLNECKFSWNNSLGQTTTMKWSSQTSKYYNLKDIYIDNETDGNNYFIEKEEGWESSDSNPWIMVSLPNSEVACAVRYAFAQDSGEIKKIKMFGSNAGACPTSHSDCSWTQIKFTGNQDTFKNPFNNGQSYNVDSIFITAELDNNIKYKHYLFYVEEKLNTSISLRLIGFELYAKKTTSETVSTINNDYLTSMRNDDFSEIKASNGAACSTPYGLVYSGGFDDSGKATQASMLYWPHAINKYDGNFYQYGIPRSLPDMKVARAKHVLVWHKGKIYAIGGLCNTDIRSTLEGNQFAECLDYNNSMEWKQINSNKFFIQDSTFKFQELERFNLGACSFGDEILIFGGQKINNHLLNAFAWNPETGKVRKITRAPITLVPCCAVPFGSKIYLIGMNANNLKILEYTP